MTNDHNREIDLVTRMAEGDRAAMRMFYDDYSGYLTVVCSRYVTARDDVKDVLQDSFIKIFGSMGRFEYRGPGALRAWATKIVVNESLRHLEARKRAPLPMIAESWGDTDADERPDHESVPAAVVMEMIRALPDGYRTVFNLFVFEQKSHREIASTLGIAESSSASQFHRARGMLARRIKEYVLKNEKQNYG
jgi:RNA polymerase sigma-70 factor (ECF subfamily)